MGHFVTPSISPSSISCIWQYPCKMYTFLTDPSSDLHTYSVIVKSVEKGKRDIEYVYSMMITQS
jgi:hypothetical protein